MHELSIATSLVSLASDAAENADEDARILRVRVRVGALSGVVVEALEFAWDVATEHTRCEGAGLQIERVPGVIHCDKCTETSELGDPPCFVCSCCGEPVADLVAGRELELVALELDVPEPTPEPPHEAPNP